MRGIILHINELCIQQKLETHKFETYMTISNTISAIPRNHNESHQTKIYMTILVRTFEVCIIICGEMKEHIKS